MEANSFLCRYGSGDIIDYSLFNVCQCDTNVTFSTGFRSFFQSGSTAYICLDPQYAFSFAQIRSYLYFSNDQADPYIGFLSYANNTTVTNTTRFYRINNTQPTTRFSLSYINSSTGAYVAVSDRSRKNITCENYFESEHCCCNPIKCFANKWTKIKKFNFKDGVPKEFIGYVSNDFLKCSLLSQACDEEKQGTGVYFIDQTGMNYCLFAVCSQLAKENLEQKKINKDLEKRIERLEAMIDALIIANHDAAKRPGSAR